MVLGGKSMNLIQVTNRIEEWAEEREIDGADPTKQMLKLIEEVGELAQGLAKDNLEQIVDSLGDVYVVLTILSMQLGLDLDYCINRAYEEIKDRKGKMVNGVFVKESDLHD
jgi:NTP pyrophosphatase (non-canonical NTP hydrolase)